MSANEDVVVSTLELGLIGVVSIFESSSHSNPPRNQQLLGIDMSLQQSMVKGAEKSPRDMDLPLKVREEIVGTLLPNLVEVRGYNEYYSEESRHQFCGDRARYYIAIMCVSQQLYDEASRLLCNRVTNITIDIDGVIVLNDVHHTELPIALPTFTWHKAKQLRIVLPAEDLALYLLLIRSNLARVCEHLHSAASLEYTRVDFFDSTS
ncbi:hypothetical protein N7G274_007987 [Stereocaulon virgatum]|uniref:Uncharacterized protein n=1 Tax=Stereocaulon virgatum TaxID=373712 RepID=A0ABR4A3M7_9LECA